MTASPFKNNEGANQDIFSHLIGFIGLSGFFYFAHAYKTKLLKRKEKVTLDTFSLFPLKFFNSK